MKRDRCCLNCGIFVVWGALCWECVRAMLISGATVVGAWIARELTR